MKLQFQSIFVVTGTEYRWHLLQLEPRGRAGAFSSGQGAKYEGHPGQGTSPSQRRNRQTHSLAHTHKDYWHFSTPVHLTCISSDCGRSPELPAYPKGKLISPLGTKCSCYGVSVISTCISKAHTFEREFFLSISVVRKGLIHC